MSCCEGTTGGLERYPGTGCCGTSCAAGKTGCAASEPRIRSCFCQENVGCLDRADCGGFRPRGTAATGACPGPCQCAEEEAWNRNVPPKPNCEWLTNFSELRRQWSDHGRQNNCKCCNCKPCGTAAPCKPCLPPAPTCSIDKFGTDDCQDCRNTRLSGGACYQSQNSSSPRQRDCGPPMCSTGGCPPPSCNRSSSSACSPTSCQSPCSSPSDCSIPAPCRQPSSCQPCSPSPRPILKKRSCCQCISGYCMCQPMPRNCNCPPPVQVDARAERECSCECPSSPECACPPSERKFPRTKVKCPNARMCCPTPRPQPGPKCCCTKCQPCMPPPCDPCTSSMCRTVLPKVKPCCGDSPCPDSAPCRPEPSQIMAAPCKPVPPCAECRKMAPPCRQPDLGNLTAGSRSGTRQMRLLNQPRTQGARCQSSGTYRPTGQSRDRHDNNEDGKFISRTDEGYGDDDEAELGGVRCYCGPPGSRESDVDGVDLDDAQCRCGSSIATGHIGCAENCDHCCSVDCDAGPQNFVTDVLDQGQCGCGSDGNICAESCDHCCSQNCDSGVIESIRDPEKSERIGAGGADGHFDLQNPSKIASRSVSWKDSSDMSEIYQSNLARRAKANRSGTRLVSIPERPNCDSIPNCESLKCDTARPKVASRQSAACKLFRSLIRVKSSMKYLQK